jgi:putative ABC transport system substrate-binding protein
MLDLRRRQFIPLIVGAAAWPLAARAQQQKMPVIGYFSGRSPDAEAPIRVPFLKALEESGFAAGRNVAIEYRFSEGQDDRLPGLAAELVRRQVAILVATDRPSVWWVKFGSRLTVSGMLNGVRGSSDIRIIVSVGPR